MAMVIVPGCGAKPPQSLIPIEQLIAEYNTNASAVPRLWARVKIAATIVDDQGRTWHWGSTSPLAGANGLLMLTKNPDPLATHDFVLIGRELAGVEVFRLGSSAAEDVYYMWLSAGDASLAWWGLQKHAGAAGVKALPIEPNHLLGILGICELPSNLTDLPAVALAMSTDPYAYVVSYIDRQADTGKIVFRREVYFNWDDTELRRPFMVNILDDTGRRVMTARLSDYEPIAAADGEPVMPTNIEITWLKTKSRIHLVLSEMTVEPKGLPEAFGFRLNLPAGMAEDDIIQVDAHLTSGESAR